MEIFVKVLGLTSAALTTTSFLPQAIKTWKTRSTDDLSPLMFTLFCIGILGWLFYGIFIEDLPMILANIVTIILAGSIMFFILAGRKQHKVRIGHIGIWAEDIDKLSEFYAYWFGAAVGPRYVNSEKGFSSVFVDFKQGVRLEIMHRDDQATGKNQNGNMHLAFSLGSKENVDMLAGEMVNSGIALTDGPRWTGDGYYEFKFSDPENNTIEITI